MSSKMSLVVFFSIILILPTAVGVAHQGEPMPTTMYNGPMLLIPYINDSPKVDGSFSLSKYPELGHMENITGFEDEITFSNNGSFLFIRMTYKNEGVAGFGLLTRGFTNKDKYLYFLAIDNGTRVVESNDEYTAPYTQINSSVSLMFFHSLDNNNISTAEFSIPIINNSIDRLQVPTGGNTFYIMVMHGDENDLLATDVLKSPMFSAYMMRNGENAVDISKIMANNPNWVDIFGYPVILLVLGVLTVVYYFKKNTKTKI